MRRSDPFFARPRILDGLIRPERCASLLGELELAKWCQSAVIQPRPLGRGRVVGSARRISETADERWFSAEVTSQLRQVGRKLERVIPAFEARRERWQATRYRVGGKFDYHFDCGRWPKTGAGDREYTALIFLNAPKSGGGTHFLHIDVEVKPVAGRLVLWSNLRPDGSHNEDSLHAGLPVNRGQKIVLVTWVRQRMLT